MNNLIISILIGLVAALADIVPMLIKKLDKLFILSAFTMWLIIGIVNTFFRIVDNSILNGLIITSLFFIPLSFLIFRQDNSAFFQICITTVILGILIGFSSGTLIK